MWMHFSIQFPRCVEVGDCEAQAKTHRRFGDDDGDRQEASRAGEVVTNVQLPVFGIDQRAVDPVGDTRNGSGPGQA